jgi:hypothetical protein
MEWMKCDFNLLCYGLFKISQIVIIFKALLSIKKKSLKNFFFVIFFNVL